MTNRQFKEDVKREDFFLSAFNRCKVWVSSNTKTCVIGVVVIILLAVGGWSYSAYLSTKSDRVQYELSGAIKYYEEYLMSKKMDALPKAEAAFRTVEKNGSGGLRDVARLYLARIDATKGNKGEAKALYDQVAKKSTSPVTRKLAETGLREVSKTN